METCVFAGTFDPVTKGHKEIVLSALNKYGKVVVVVGVNDEKTPFFTLDERLSFLRKTFENEPRVEIDFFGGYMADYMKEKGYIHYIRGIRGKSDLPYENLMIKNNLKRNPDMVTDFIFAKNEYAGFSSTVVRERIEKGLPYAEFLPENILPLVDCALKKRLQNK